MEGLRGDMDPTCRGPFKIHYSSWGLYTLHVHSLSVLMEEIQLKTALARCRDYCRKRWELYWVYGWDLAGLVAGLLIETTGRLPSKMSQSYVFKADGDLPPTRWASHKWRKPRTQHRCGWLKGVERCAPISPSRVAIASRSGFPRYYAD